MKKKGNFLLPRHTVDNVPNIYADKASCILEWMLLKGIDKDLFSLREVAKETEASLGNIHAIFSALVFNGYLKVKGIRTNKRFFVNDPQRLLMDWIDNYSIVDKCKIWSYSTAFSSKKQLIDALLKSGLQKNVVLALHSAAEAHKCKHTTLEQQLELYILQPSMRQELEKVLQLQPKERGYDVLLIEPYYKSLIKRDISIQKQSSNNGLFHTPELLTFLDLYHFPLRGIEQAEWMADQIPKLKKIYKRGSF